MKSKLKKAAEKYAETAQGIDGPYEAGLYYGFMEGAKYADKNNSKIFYYSLYYVIPFLFYTVSTLICIVIEKMFGRIAWLYIPFVMLSIVSGFRIANKIYRRRYKQVEIVVYVEQIGIGKSKSIYVDKNISDKEIEDTVNEKFDVWYSYDII